MTADDGTANQLPKLVIRKNGGDDLRKYCGVTYASELEPKMGVSRAQISRVLSGKHDAGNQFIASVIVLCGLEFTFTKVFEVKK
jgi:hypothetical protein